MQEASHWLTILRLVEAGLGVSVAPASVRHIASGAVVCLPLRGGAKLVSNVELAWRNGDKRSLVQRFAAILTNISQRG